MSRRDLAQARRRYLEQLAPPDVRGGARLVEELVAEGTSIGAVVQEVLRPAQIEVGRRWQLNQWTVADEHAASAVTEAALMAAAGAVSDRATTPLGRVVLACAAGEWHTLPLRMVSEIVAEAGFQSVFLGPSVPADHLRDYLRHARPLALALNCSYALTLEGAAACVDAAHSVGIPVLVGGRGFGADAHRASMLGADAWTDEPAHAVDILTAWSARPPTDLAAARVVQAEPMPGDEELSVVRRQTVSALCAAFPACRAYSDRQWAQTHQDIDYIVRFGVTAVRYDDGRIFSEFAGWLREVLAARKVPSTVVDTTLLALGQALEERRPLVSALIRSALAPAPPASPDDAPGRYASIHSARSAAPAGSPPG